MPEPRVNNNTTKRQPLSQLGELQVAPDQLYHCAVIDATGTEIPITRDMIEQACTALEDQASSFYKKFSSHQIQ